MFPIGFDLARGVKEAIDSWNKTYAKQLEDGIQKKPAKVLLETDPSKVLSEYGKIKTEVEKPLTVFINANLLDVDTKIKNLKDKLTSPESGLSIKAKLVSKEITDEWTKVKKEIEKTVYAKVSISAPNLKKLEEVKEKLEGIKISPLSPEIKTSINQLTQELNKLADALKTLDKYTSKRISASPDAVRAARIDEIDSRKKGRADLDRAKVQDKLTESADKHRIAQERLAQAQERTRQAMERTAQQANRSRSSYSGLSEQIQRFTQRMLMFASLDYMKNFLTRIREVTAEFELQRVALGAIIQDQNRANMLFDEIKSFALKSPLKIMDLTKYTKQLAAYRIETDKLFDTTKRLADVSVGVGVGMDRLILAYGQIRAAGFLRATEVRQLTEAGIPIVEELAKKLSAANGELVRANDVMDMISKREIPFEMVADVFEDMTNKGGVFYDMQEKQGNTLFGLWAKLGDAASMMYNDIGNTKMVNDAMKNSIGIMRSVMLHWKQVGVVIGAVTVAIASHVVMQKQQALVTNLNSAANAKHVASLKAVEMQLVAEQRALMGAKNWQNAVTTSTLALTRAQIQAATATNVFSKAFYGLKAAILSNPIGLLATALVTVIGLIMTSESELGKLKSKLESIELDYGTKNTKDVSNFKELADAVVNNIDGSKKQKDALDELNRTYGQILGSEALQVESLRNLNGKYGELTETIKAYNAVKKGEERATAIKSSYDRQIEDAKGRLTDYLKTYGASDAEISEFFAKVQADIIDGVDAVDAMQKHLVEVTHSNGQMFINAIDIFDLDRFTSTWSDSWRTFWSGFSTDRIYAFANAIKEQNQMLDENAAKTKEDANTMGAYADDVDNISRALQNLDWSSLESLKASVEYFNKSHVDNQIVFSFTPRFDASKAKSESEKALEQANAQITSIMFQIQNIAKKDAIRAAEKAAEAAGKVLPEAIKTQIGEKAVKEVQNTFIWMKSVVDGNKDFQIIDFDALAKMPLSSNAQAAVREFRKMYEKLIPADDTVKVTQRRLREITDSFKGNADKMKKYLMQNGENLEEYRKRIKDEIEKLTNALKTFTYTKKFLEMFGLPVDIIQAQMENTEKELEILKKLFAEMPNFDKDKKGKQSDPRLQTLQEIANKMAEINKEYDDLLKKEGQTKALADTQKLFASAFADMDKVAKKYKFKLPAFETPQTVADVQKWYQAVIDEIKRLNIKNADKVLIELGFKRDKAGIDEYQKQIEKELKELSDRISQSKAAREFYDKILTQTGDVDLAANVTFAIYGDMGEDIFEQQVEQIRKVFETSDGWVIDLDRMFDFTNKRIDYALLAQTYDDMQKHLIEANKDTAKKIISEGQKASAKQVETWEKELAKAKDYEQQRTDIINRESQRRAEIIKSYTYTPEEKEQRLQASQKKQDKEIADLNFKEFKESEDYIKIFENLDNVSTAALQRLRANIEAVIAANADLSPENMKTLVKAMEDIDNQIAGRGFGNVMIQSVKDYIAALRELKVARTDLKSAQADYDAQEPMLDANISVAKQEENNAQQSLNDLKSSGLATDEQIVAAELRLNAATANVAKAENNKAKAENDKAKAANKVKKAEQKVTDLQDDQRKASEKFFDDMQKVAQSADQLASILGDVKDILGVSEDSVAGLAFDAAIGSLQEFSKIMNVIIALQILYNVVTSSNPWMAIAAAVLAVSAALAGFISANKVRKANKEIEKQQKILDQLEYSYGRLEKAMDKAFGGEYIRNYNQQLSNLQAQLVAKQKQLNAEESKGKKKDNEKMQGYKDDIRDIKDQIADLQGSIFEKFAGSDLTSLARDFAQSWLDAYKEYGNTLDAMRGKFRDVMENMVIEGALAAVMKRALEPMYNMIEDMGDQDFYNQDFWRNVVAEAEKGANAANAGAATMMQFLEQAGISIRDLGGDLTGISRDIAQASEESINGLAAGINTQNYYIAQQLTEVVAIRTLLESGGMGATPIFDYSSMLTLQNEHLSQLPIIAANTASTVERCERAAIACEAMAEKIGQVVKPKGSKMAVNMNMV